MNLFTSYFFRQRRDLRVSFDFVLMRCSVDFLINIRSSRPILPGEGKQKSVKRCYKMLVNDLSFGASANKRLIKCSEARRMPEKEMQTL